MENKYYNQIMTKKEMSIEEAETIIDDMYQDKNKILSERDTIFVDRIGTVQYTNLEFASVRALREIQSLRHKLEKQEKENTDLKELYVRTAKHQEKIGHTELADYMLAQIEAVPTFTTCEEYTTWVSKDKIREILEYYGHTPADNPDTTMAFYSDIKKLLEDK